MTVVPADRDLARTTWITSDKSKPDTLILCQGCKGVLYFRLGELLERKARGTNTSTPCRHCGWHPGFPPEPYLPFDGTITREASA